jgi:signal transduction histidine kinase
MSFSMISRWPVKLMIAITSGSLWAQETEALESNPDVLTRVESIRTLEVADAQRALPIRLRGTVMLDAHTSSGTTSLYIADESAGIYMAGDPATCGALRRGQLVEIEGCTVIGLFNPYIWCEKITDIGSAPIPEPHLVDFGQLSFGRYVAQWVKIRGIIRRVEPMSNGPETWRFEMVSGGGRLSGMLRSPAAVPPPVDAEVEVSAICTGRFDKSRQWLGTHLIVPGGVPITVLTPPSAEPPIRPMDRLMAFHSDDSNLHRVRVRGVVTHCSSSEGFWMQDGSRGLQVITKSSVDLIPGQLVEALGFAAPGKYSPVLEDVTVTLMAKSRPLSPLRLSAPAEALQHGDQLVSLEGIVTNQKPVAEGVSITLMNDSTEFELRLDRLAEINPKVVWPIGTKLRATGICVVTDVAPATVLDLFVPGSFAAPGGKRRIGRDLDFGPQQPWAFKLLARSPADLLTLSSPPWWTPSRIAWLLGLISLALVVGIGTVLAFSRHRLHQSSLARRQAEAEFAAILSERSRIAREIHDTLAQSLGATSLHLELVKDHLPPESEGAKNLAEARRLTLGSLTETRNSIWEMRSQALETGDLASALMDVRDQLTDIHGIKGRFDLSGTPYRLPPLSENNLLRIGQEAITNAVKHARPTRVDVSLVFMPGKLQLQISDDGCGFDPGHLPTGETHFGWLGLRERAREIHAELTVHSAPNKGTRVDVILHHLHSNNPSGSHNHTTA